MWIKYCFHCHQFSHHRDSHEPSFYRVKKYDINKHWLKSKAKPITEVSSSEDPHRLSPVQGKKNSRSLTLEGNQVHDIIQGAVSGVVGNFVGITRAVRQRILPDKQLLEVCLKYALLV